MYPYKDHLGNIRINYAWDDEANELTVLNEHHYYPFGLEHAAYNTTKREFKKGESNNHPVLIEPVENSGYQYKYNGKELQDELGLNAYDYGARFYYPDAPHFWQIDPKAEEFSFQSPYVYAVNNPIYFIDKDGMSPDCCGNPLGTGSTVLKIGLKVVSWVKSKIRHDKGYTGSRGHAPGSGFVITGQPAEGNAGQMVADHPEDNIEVDYNVLMSGTGITKGHTFPKNAVESAKVIVDAIETAEQIVNFETNSTSSDTSSKSNSTTMNRETQQDKDTTVTARYPNGIKDFNPDIEGGFTLSDQKDSTVTIPKSQVKAFIGKGQRLIKVQDEKASKTNHKDIDINTGGE